MVETDDITIYYSVEPQTSEIARVANDQREEIEDILKKPFLPSSSLANKENLNVITQKKIQVNLLELLHRIEMEMICFLIRLKMENSTSLSAEMHKNKWHFS